ncbi:hypothetical protein QL285_057645 [Trifolium repens]|nr:hypothetical protein QL285_057645 [Trifolium repens]
MHELCKCEYYACMDVCMNVMYALCMLTKLTGRIKLEVKQHRSTSKHSANLNKVLISLETEQKPLMEQSPAIRFNLFWGSRNFPGRKPSTYQRSESQFSWR